MKRQHEYAQKLYIIYYIDIVTWLERILQENSSHWYLTISVVSQLLVLSSLVVLDTNKWFHQTDIIGNEMSITIGSEYD